MAQLEEEWRWSWCHLIGAVSLICGTRNQSLRFAFPLTASLFVLLCTCPRTVRRTLACLPDLKLSRRQDLLVEMVLPDGLAVSAREEQGVVPDTPCLTTLQKCVGGAKFRFLVKQPSRALVQKGQNSVAQGRFLQVSSQLASRTRLVNSRLQRGW